MRQHQMIVYSRTSYEYYVTLTAQFADLVSVTVVVPTEEKILWLCRLAVR